MYIWPSNKEAEKNGGEMLLSLKCCQSGKEKSVTIPVEAVSKLCLPR